MGFFVRLAVPVLGWALCGAAAMAQLGADLDLAARLQPAPASSVFVDPGYYVWCGTMVRAGDGRYHLYYSRWPKALGFSAWVTHSEIAHAVGDTPLGPFHFAGVALGARGRQFWDGLCAHNPTILRTNGKYYLYYMGNTGDGKAVAPLNWMHRNNQRVGVAVATSPNGPWRRLRRPVLDVSSDASVADSLVTTNPTVFRRADGRYQMIYKAVGRERPLPFGGPVVHLTATSDSPTGPFTKQMRPIFLAPGVDFPAEDPFAWYDRSRNRYYAVVKDNQGNFTHAGRSLALWESSDGFDWKLAAHPLVSTTDIAWADGRRQHLFALERPQLAFDDGGQPVVLLCAADPSSDHAGTFNVRIPLASGAVPVRAGKR